MGQRHQTPEELAAGMYFILFLLILLFGFLKKNNMF